MKLLGRKISPTSGFACEKGEKIEPFSIETELVHLSQEVGQMKDFLLMCVVIFMCLLLAFTGWILSGQKLPDAECQQSKADQIEQDSNHPSASGMASNFETTQVVHADTFLKWMVDPLTNAKPEATQADQGDWNVVELQLHCYRQRKDRKPGGRDHLVPRIQREVLQEVHQSPSSAFSVVDSNQQGNLLHTGDSL